VLSFSRFFAVLSLAIFLTYPAVAQQGIVYTATVIPAIAQSGGSTTVRIQIAAWTTDAEKAQLKQVFAKDGSDKGMALLRSMSKGYVNVAGQGGRKIYAAFTQDSPEGKRIILVSEHILSEYEKTQNVSASNYPLSIARIQFDTLGHPQSGKVYPAARVTVTPDGFVDVDTQTPNTATMIDIARSN
jgi:hypothetical protein